MSHENDGCDVAIIRLLLTSEEPLWMTKIVEKLSSRFTKRDISMTMDKLDDLCLIYSKYEKVGKWWTCCYHVEEDLKETLAKVIGEKVRA